ncbi:hypothetical protein V8F33_004372 [Rhypophila sp. PSN 637]
MFRACYTAHRIATRTAVQLQRPTPLHFNRYRYRYHTQQQQQQNRFLSFSTSSKMASAAKETHNTKPHAVEVEEEAAEQLPKEEKTARNTSFLVREPEPEIPRPANQAPLPLPAPEDVSPAQDQERTRTVEVNGQAIALDHLGPTVVNRDGTLGRIANWPEMTPWERENTLRVLGKRNQLRLAGLRGEKPQSETESAAKGE